MNRLGRSMAAVLLLIAGLVFLPAPRPALGAYPGGNGRIAFDECFHCTRHGISSINPDGTGHGVLIPNASTPSFSPDGQQIAYTSTSREIDEGAGIWYANVDGSNPKRVTTSADDTALSWSPDEKKLAFSRWPDIYVINLDGTGLLKLTTDADTPSWSPDGSKIAFGGWVEADTCGTSIDALFTINPNGSGLTEIYRDEEDSSGCGERLIGLNTARGLDWSPDGLNIVVVGQQAEDDLWAIPTQLTGGPIKLTAQSGENFISPAWSPDGAKIAFATVTSGSSQGRNIEVLAISDGISAPIYSGDVLGGVDWQSFLEPSSVTVAVRTRSAKVLVSGSVSPPRPGSSVEVSLFRKRGGRYVKVGKNVPTLNDDSAFATSFKRTAAGSCKVTAVFRGDHEVVGSKTSKTFKC